MEQATETKRDRVRRLLIDPLKRDGMRFRHGTTDEEAQKRLARMADDLTYMSDQALSRLLICLRTKGDGSKGNFWPSRVSVLKYANMAQPRQIEDIPGLKSWFVSAAGVAAAAEPGRLVAEYLFWCKHFHPPVHDSEKRGVTLKARELADREAYLSRRQSEGARLDAQDSDWLTRYRARDAMLRKWIKGDAA